MHNIIIKIVNTNRSHIIKILLWFATIGVFSLSNNPKFQARFRVMSFVLAKNVYSLIKALYW